MSDNLSLDLRRTIATGLKVAILTVKTLRDMSPEEGQKLLRSFWLIHREDYLSEKNNREALVAVIVIDAYFAAFGNWSKMIGLLEDKLHRVHNGEFDLPESLIRKVLESAR